MALFYFCPIFWETILILVINWQKKAIWMEEKKRYIT
jgi:hypothetical protein